MESNSLTAAIIAVSVFAGVVTVVAVILLIMLLKRQSDIKGFVVFSLYLLYTDVANLITFVTRT